MKKTILYLSTYFIVAAVQAQGKFYVLPSIGAGISNASQHFSSPLTGEIKDENKAVFNYNAQLSVGYKYKHWSIETGVQYLTTGNDYLETFSTVLPGNMPGLITQYARFKYTCITIPIQLGYEIPVGTKFSVTPMLGTNIGFNLSEKCTYKDLSSGTEKTIKLSHDLNGNDYKNISIWGNAGIRLAYKLNERWAIVGGPAFQYMLTNFTEEPAIGTIFKSTQRNYALDFNLGVKVIL